MKNRINFCLRCDNHTFSLDTEAKIEQEFHGVPLLVTTTVYRCTKCGLVKLNGALADVLTIRTLRAYIDKLEERLALLRR